LHHAPSTGHTAPPTGRVPQARSAGSHLWQRWACPGACAACSRPPPRPWRAWGCAPCCAACCGRGCGCGCGCACGPSPWTCRRAGEGMEGEVLWAGLQHPAQQGKAGSRESWAAGAVAAWSLLPTGFPLPAVRSRTCCPPPPMPLPRSKAHPPPGPPAAAALLAVPALAPALAAPRAPPVAAAAAAAAPRALAAHLAVAAAAAAAAARPARVLEWGGAGRGGIRVG